MLELILKRFSASGQDEAEIISAEQLAAWPQQEVTTLKRHGILKKAAPAKTIECPGCENACLMPVHVFPAQDDRPARLFVACDKREDTGRVLIESATLEQWQIDISRFASLLASALGTGHIPDEIIPQQAFYLGALTIKRKRRSAFFIANAEILDSALDSGLFRKYGHPIFLVAAGLNNHQEFNHNQTILPLAHLFLFSDFNSLSFDYAMLENLISMDANNQQTATAIFAGENGTKQNIFRREGQMWTLCFNGETKNFKHSKGLLYISYLLGSPFQEYHVAELVKAFENPDQEVLSFSSGEISTKETIKNYRKRLSEIRIDFSEAERTENPLLKKELEEEKVAIEKQLLQAVGFGGRLKKNPDETRRQAKAVSEAISRTLKVIDKDHPALWRHLHNSINRGEYLSYTPDTETSWVTIQ